MYTSSFNALTNQAEREGLQRWQRAILNDIEERVTETKPKKLDLLIGKGIRDLRAMDVILKQADKNLGIVPIHGHVYNRMVMDHIGERATYGKVNRFPVEAITQRMGNIIGAARVNPYYRAKWMKQAEGDPQPCPFYVMPKLHKKKMFASRPVTVQHSYILAPLSKALAQVLQEVVETIPEIARDSKTVAQRLDTFKFAKPGVFLTYDVEALYPSIDLHDAIQTLSDNVPVLGERNGFWLKILKLIMFNNYVSFKGQVYRQLQGTATGTHVAPPFANLYLFFKCRHILERDSIQLQSRFIDDGFIIVDTEEEAESIARDLNGMGNLKFTYEVSKSEAVYLDLHIYKGDRFRAARQLDFKVFFKAINKFLYLPARSHHPMAMKLGIVKGEAIRCLRNCTSKVEWLKALHIIFKGLMARGYNPIDVKKKWKEVRFEDRQEYLHGYSQAKGKPEGKLVLTTYSDKTRATWKWLIQRNSVPRRLMIRGKKMNVHQRDIRESWPPKIVFKNFPKLGRFLISSTAEWSKKNSRKVREGDRVEVQELH